ncbi:DUF6461 domain-containing protein [Streptomyces sp. PTD5-9]|uniref:DUF6461 domain-containing protein n=1 Tax=Streptomyces sp. PTD5-9 TaxID=3120150 RepID=UPI003008C5A4
MQSDHTEPRPSTSWADHEIMWCLTFTHGLAPSGLLTRYGARPEEAQLLEPQEAYRLGQRIGDEGLTATVLRIGAIGDWAFCLEEWGWLGSTAALLTRLSQGTETLSLQQDARGCQAFQFWRDGHLTERFEPGMPSTRPEPPHPWWDAVELRRSEAAEEFPGWDPVLRAVSEYTGATLSNKTVNSPLLTVLLQESSQGYGPPQPETVRSLGYGIRLTQTDPPPAT